MRKFCAGCLVVLGLSAFAPGVAPAEWGSSQVLSPAGESAQSPDVAVGRDGTTVVAWRRFDGTAPMTPCCYRVEARVRRPGHKFSKVKALSTPGQNASGPEVSVGADGTAVVIYTRFDGTDPPFTCCDRVQARVYHKGKWGAAETLSGAGQDAMDADVGVARHGKAVAIWTREQSDFGPRRLQARFRPSGEGTEASFGGFQNLAPPGDYAYSPDLDVASNGRAVVVWQRLVGPDYRISAKVRPPGEDFSAKAKNLSPAGEEADYPVVDLAPNGTGLVAWVLTGPGLDYTLQARTRGREHFGALKDVSKKSTGDYAALAADNRGRASVAWEQNGDPYPRIKVRTRSRTSGFGKGKFLSKAGQPAQSAQLSIGADRAAFAGWLRSDGASISCCLRVQTRRRPPGGHAFSMLDTLTGGGETATELQLAAASAKRAFMVWLRSDGSDARVEVSRYSH